jgi:hypothetical protein
MYLFFAGDLIFNWNFHRLIYLLMTIYRWWVTVVPIYLVNLEITGNRHSTLHLTTKFYEYGNAVSRCRLC